MHYRYILVTLPLGAVESSFRELKEQEKTKLSAVETQMAALASRYSQLLTVDDMTSGNTLPL
jgi:hypothetical protein